MEDLHMTDGSHCGDLERLAAAAATVGYSTDPMIHGTHRIESVSNPEQNLVPTIVSNFSGYEPSRPQQYTTIRFTEYNPRTVIEPTREPTNHVLLDPGHNRQTQFTVIDRPDRTQFVPTNSVVPGKSFNIGHIVAPGVQYIDAKLVNSTPEQVEEPLSIPVISETTGSRVIQLVSSNVPERPAPKPVSTLKKKGKGESPQKGGSKMTLEMPEPENIDGVPHYPCPACGESFKMKYHLKRHFVTHTGEKRGALSLETKVEIVKRMKDGEKQVDLAMEYNIGRSTLSFIAKNADMFVNVIKGGKFNPDNKRMRGALREDVEDALSEWYKQAMQLNMPVSGPILCKKAKDFALKLGYKEFKATHGWLDRFKHRKSIVLTRNKNLKMRDPKEPQDIKVSFLDQTLPEILMDYQQNNIFYASEFGLFYKILPDQAHEFKGSRSSGGIHSKERLTVIVCCNASGTEKFPLFISSRSAESKAFEGILSFPFQFSYDVNSWMTEETFVSWLTDLDRWFTQQNRKTVLVLSSLPVHPKNLKFNSMKIVVSPPTFIGPMELGIVHVLKSYYRTSLLQSLVSSMEEDKTSSKRRKSRFTQSHDFLYYLHKLSAAWHSVTSSTISDWFFRAGLSNGNWNAVTFPNDFLMENLHYFSRLKCFGLKIDPEFTFDDYVSFDDDLQVCYLMDDDDIIASVKAHAGEDDVSDPEEHTKPPEPNSLQEEEDLRTHLNTINRYIYNTSATEEVLRTFSELQFILAKT